MNLAQAVGIVGGIWLMAAPAVLGYADTTAAAVHRIVGPLAASAALIAVWEATRGVRLLNVALGPLLVIAPLLGGHPVPAVVNGVACGVALAAAAPFGGTVTSRMAGGWRSLWGAKTTAES